MSRAHREIQHLARLLARLAEGLRKQGYLCVTVPPYDYSRVEKVKVALVAAVSADLTSRFNAGKIVKFGSRPVLLVRVNETEWRAFSAVCTHLNCTVQYQETSHQIWCACHNGLYDLNGRVVSGPPPRPLDEFTVHLRGEDVIVSRRA